MRVIHPASREEGLDDLYVDLRFPAPPAGRPLVYLDLVASVDGAATVAGRTAGLGGEADDLAFRRLREWCDAILVGASTLRIESYGPPRPAEDARERRVRRGLAVAPRLVVVTASGVIDPAGRAFSDPANPPLVLVPPDAPPDRLAALEPVAEVRTVSSGRGGLDLGAAVALLRDLGVGRLLCEGGPTLNGHLMATDVVDEIFLTVASCVVGGAGPRIVVGGLADGPLPFVLVEAREHDDELLLRYRRKR